MPCRAYCDPPLSAIVLLAGNVTIFLFSMAAFMEARFEDCTPITLIFGLLSPYRAGHSCNQSGPPPMGITKASRSPCWPPAFPRPSVPLAGDHRLIVEWVNKCEAKLFAAANCFLACFLVIRARQNYFRSIAARGGHFYERRGQRHTDLRFDAALCGVISHSLGVISGGSCNHSAPPLFLRQQKNFQLSAPRSLNALFGQLQIFQLQENRIAGLP